MTPEFNFENLYDSVLNKADETYEQMFSLGLAYLLSKIIQIKCTSENKNKIFDNISSDVDLNSHVSQCINFYSEMDKLINNIIKDEVVASYTKECLKDM